MIANDDLSTGVGIILEEQRQAPMEDRRKVAVSAARIAPLLPPIYEAATDPSKWQVAFAGVVHALGGNSGLIFSHQATPGQHGIWVPYQCSDEGLRRYAERYHAFDIWMQRAHLLGAFVPGNVVTGDDLLPRKEFLASVFYREHLSRYDIHDICAGVLHDGSEPDIPLVNVSIYRPLASPIFGETDKALLAALIPHLREATRIGFRTATLERRAGILHSALETISPALVLLDAQGRVVFTNGRAQKLLTANDRLRVVDGRLVVERRQQARLDALLEESSTEETMLGISRPAGKPSLWLIRVPMLLEGSDPPDARRPTIALMIHDSQATDTIDVKGFAKVHGLTPAEARLIGLLLENTSLPSVSKHLGVGIHTVRSQLSAIRLKTGARRQAELMRMLMSWPHRLDRRRPGSRAFPSSHSGRNQFG